MYIDCTYHYRVKTSLLRYVGHVDGVVQTVAWVTWVYKILASGNTFFAWVGMGPKFSVGRRGSKIWRWSKILRRLVSNFGDLKKSIAQKGHRHGNLISSQLGIKNLHAF